MSHNFEDRRVHLTDLMACQVRSQPHEPAVIDHDRVLSFSQLWQQAGEIASELHRSGASHGDLVGLFMEPTADLVASVWGILRAGAAYLPLAVDYPEDRLRFMVDDAKLGHVIADPHLVDTATNLADTDLTVTTPAGADDQHRTGTPVIDYQREDSAYVIYTSGSTGRPKGVVIDHRAITNQMNWLRDSVGLTSRSRILFKTPTSFDASQWELLANAVGTTVVVAPTGTHRDPRGICDLVQRHQVELLQCVPTLWQALVARDELGECHSLRRLFSGGEVLSTNLARQLLTALPNAELTNLYGPTETTINATYHTVDRRLLGSGEAAVGIGGPVHGCSLHILDDDRRPVDSDTAGELYIGGPQLAVGYLNRPELTAERFVTLTIDDEEVRLYRTGDRAKMRTDGRLDFCGRTDDQIKVNGHRIETDEIRIAIEDHHWVEAAAVVPWEDGADNLTHLAGFVQLDPKEAALMDQDHAGNHHRSKGSHLQTKAQLKGLALRNFGEGNAEVTALPNPDGRAVQRTTAFARKTYRHYEGRTLTADDLCALREWLYTPWPTDHRTGPITIDELADVLRWLGPFTSDNRLLAKYAYASPGALNATQVYVETNGVNGVANGLHYFHPADHTLHLLDTQSLADDRDPSVRIHLVGIPRVITSVYCDNVEEVLRFEAGHMAGVLDRAVSEYGHHLTVVEDRGSSYHLDEEFIVSAVLELAPGPAPDDTHGAVDLFVQVHGQVADVPKGIYRSDGDCLEQLTTELVERRHVVAINQETYDRSSFAVALLSNASVGWDGYVALGRALQKIQMNDQLIGLMSSGYSSQTGRGLPSASRIDDLLGGGHHLSYFAVAGSISAAQRDATGMKEDAVHTRGPLEILRDDLRRSLPHYMVPARLELIDAIPQTANGKADRSALISRVESMKPARREVVLPRTSHEAAVAKIWETVLDSANTSIHDDLFEVGGDSLAAVELVHALNDALGSDLPVQAIFEASTIAELAARTQGAATPDSRIVPLAAGSGQPIYIWPGLGGYPMNLRHLAQALSNGRPVYGIQTHGLNPGESPHATLDAMVAADGEAILAHTQHATLTLVGYSFGARLASDTAAWLNTYGIEVDQVVLIAPGSPIVDGAEDDADKPDFQHPYYRKILASVFLGSLGDGLTDAELSVVSDRESFLQFVERNVPGFSQALAHRIIDVVASTFRMRHSAPRPLGARIERTHVVTAVGDQPSFVHRYGNTLAHRRQLTELPQRHYEVLHSAEVGAVAHAISNQRITAGV